MGKTRFILLIAIVALLGVAAVVVMKSREPVEPSISTVSNLADLKPSSLRYTRSDRSGSPGQANRNPEGQSGDPSDPSGSARVAANQGGPRSPLKAHGNKSLAPPGIPDAVFEPREQQGSHLFGPIATPLTRAVDAGRVQVLPEGLFLLHPDKGWLKFDRTRWVEVPDETRPVHLQDPRTPSKQDWALGFQRRNRP